MLVIFKETIEFKVNFSLLVVNIISIIGVSDGFPTVTYFCFHSAILQ